MMFRVRWIRNTAYLEKIDKNGGSQSKGWFFEKDKNNSELNSYRESDHRDRHSILMLKCSPWFRFKASGRFTRFKR